MAKKQMISYKALMERVDFYFHRGIKYDIERSGQSIYLECENGMSYYSIVIDDSKEKKRLPINEIGFIRRVKQYIIKNDLHNSIAPNYKKRENIKFFNFNRDIPFGGLYKKPYSIDIKSAYWDAAYKEGLLSPELYEEGQKIPDKRVRLASLGTFAKKRQRWRFDGKKEKMRPAVDPTHPHVFFNQANTVYRLMERCRKAAGDDYLFYWTDGIYVKTKEAAEKCQEVLSEASFRYETDQLISIERTFEGFETFEWVEKEGVRIKKPKIFRANII